MANVNATGFSPSDSLYTVVVNPADATSFSSGGTLYTVVVNPADATSFGGGSLYGVDANSVNANYFSYGVLYNAVVNPAPATYFAPALVTVTKVANVRYYQRVFSSGLSAWCYYSTLNTVDPSPASGATSPTWTGSISLPQVLATVSE